MNKSKRTTDNDKFNPLNDADSRKRSSYTVVRDSITSIGVYAAIAVIAVSGIGLGLFGRLAYEPRPLRYRLDGFGIDLPLKPEIEHLSGMPPFSNRGVVRYLVDVSAAVQYQVLVMERDGSRKIDRSDEYNPNSTAENGDLTEWSESTIAVLCADDNHSIREKCLGPGSRLTRWHLTTADGTAVRGNLVRMRDGRLVQMLATGTSEEEAAAFFASYRPD